MSDTFGVYSAYYDLLYSDKDYRSETAYVRKLIEKHMPEPATSVLDLGCGTGIHASLLAAEGMSVLGVDASAKMLAEATRRIGSPTDLRERLSFAAGDVRDFRCSRSFDAATSIFHVMSYQTTDADLQAAFRTAAAHVRSGGVFIFDFWYGPAVLWQRPTVRVKHLENEVIQVTRVAEPALVDQANVVEVNYSVFVQERASGAIHMVREKHRMRYLFLPEIDHFLHESGFLRLQTEEWLSQKEASADSWAVCVVARKR